MNEHLPTPPPPPTTHPPRTKNRGEEAIKLHVSKISALTTNSEWEHHFYDPSTTSSFPTYHKLVSINGVSLLSTQSNGHVDSILESLNLDLKLKVGEYNGASPLMNTDGTPALFTATDPGDEQQSSPLLSFMPLARNFNVSVRMHGPGWTDVVHLKKKSQSSWRSFSLSPTKQTPDGNTKEVRMEREWE